MKKLIAANWKMNKTAAEAAYFIREFKMLVKGDKNVDIVICPPYTALSAVSGELKNSGIKLGAQNMHFEGAGAFTGEISPLMLKEIGCEYVILGHSDRREMFSEDDSLINKKITASLNHGLKPILCVGENLEQKKRGETEDVLENQLLKCLENVKPNQIDNLSIAYEPIWAISKGDPNKKAATASDAEQSHMFIRKLLEGMYGEKIARSARIIYGGSMKPENAKELLAMPNIDGGLVGNASLSPKSFAGIVKSVNN